MKNLNEKLGHDLKNVSHKTPNFDESVKMSSQADILEQIKSKHTSRLPTEIL